MKRYDDAYSSCERTLAELRIYPGQRDPDWVTDFLGIEPTETNRKGEQHQNSLGIVRTVRISSWFLSSEGKVNSKDARRHLDWLLDALECAPTRVNALVTDETVRIYVICVWWSAAGHGGPTISPSQMARLAQLGLELGFDVYFLADDDEAPEEGPSLRLV